MKLFKRTDRSVRADEHLTYFTTLQAHHFRHLVARSFAQVGRDVSVYPGHVEDRSGTTLGLWNIGALCAGTDPLDWPELIDDHVRRVTTPPRHMDELSESEFVSGLYLRLVDEASIPDPSVLGYAREVVPGLLEVLSVDLPDSVATPPEEQLRGHGELAELIGRGRANLRSLLFRDEVRSEIVDDEWGGRYTAVIGSSFFTASLALLLPETIDRFEGRGDVGRGVLVAVPCRHELLYRAIDHPDAVVAFEGLVQRAARDYAEEPGPLSPHVYWVRNHRWVQVTAVDGGTARRRMDSGLASAFDFDD